MVTEEITLGELATRYSNNEIRCRGYEGRVGRESHSGVDLFDDDGHASWTVRHGDAVEVRTNGAWKGYRIPRNHR